MFIVVRYGDGQELLFNPRCRINVLLESIKLKCNCDKGAMIDLSDEKGNMKKLFENIDLYANDFLPERDSFILIKVERKEGQDCYKFTPLLNELFISATFLDALSQAEKDTGSIKTSPKTNSRQGKKKPVAPKGKTMPLVATQSPRPEKEKSNVGKVSRATTSRKSSKLSSRD